MKPSMNVVPLEIIHIRNLIPNTKNSNRSGKINFYIGQI
jgi:hypothetical protein